MGRLPTTRTRCQWPIRMASTIQKRHMPTRSHQSPAKLASLGRFPHRHALRPLVSFCNDPARLCHPVPMANRSHPARLLKREYTHDQKECLCTTPQGQPACYPAPATHPEVMPSKKELERCCLTNMPIKCHFKATFRVQQDKTFNIVHHLLHLFAHLTLAAAATTALIKFMTVSPAVRVLSKSTTKTPMFPGEKGVSLSYL